MTKKTRTTVLLTCIACFLIGAGILVPYSMGYRFDFEKMKITATGGIYVRSYPSADQIIIDSKIKVKPGMFSNWIFVQSLLPNNHTVLVEKTGYYDYFKTLPVLKKEVTKLENILLIKKTIQFNEVLDATQSPFDKPEKYIIKNNNLYYSSAPENSELSAIQKTTPILKKVSAFVAQNNNILWLGADGFLYKSSQSDFQKIPEKLTLTTIKITKTGVYKIIATEKNILLINNGNLLILNPAKKDLENFAVTLAYKKITGFQWINDYNIVFLSENKIIISETDIRGNINSIVLPQTASQISFNQQEGKLYTLTDKTLLVSEKITP